MGIVPRMPVEWSENTVVAHLADEPAFSDEVEEVHRGLEAEPQHCVLDLSAVSFLNSSNLAQLLGLRKMVAPSGCQIVLASVPAAVWETLEVSRLDRLFRRAENVPLALATLQIEESERPAR